MNINNDKNEKFEKDMVYDQKVDKKKNPKFKGKGKKPFKGKQSNDISWHSKNMQTLSDVASYAFNFILGSLLKFKNAVLGGLQPRDVGVPTILSVCYDYFMGWSNKINSTLNNACTNLYAFMRQHNSGSVNYQSQDLFVAIVAAAVDICATIAYATKIFGLPLHFSNKNREIPRKLFYGMGIDYEDFTNNLANYRAKFNTILAKATSLIIPKEYPFFDQACSMVSAIHLDQESDTGREQIINIVKPLFHIFTATEDPNGGMVRLMKWSDIGETDATLKDNLIYLANSVVGPSNAEEDINFSNCTKFQTILDILDAQINALITDDDYNTMAGDIMKAFDKYGSGEFWQFKPLPEGYSVEIKYNEEFSRQLHNATILTRPLGYSRKTVDGRNVPYVPSTSIINNTKQSQALHIYTEFEFNGQVTNQANGYGLHLYSMNNLIDSNHMNPTPEEVVTLTRWKNWFDVSVQQLSTDGPTKVTFTHQGMSSVLLFDANLYYNYEDASGNEKEVEMIWEQYTMIGQIRKAPFLIDAFDLHPIQYIVCSNGTPASPVKQDFVVHSQLDNPVTMDNYTLQRIHDMDFNSLFNVPFTGSF